MVRWIFRSLLFLSILLTVAHARPSWAAPLTEETSVQSVNEAANGTTQTLGADQILVLDLEGLAEAIARALLDVRFEGRLVGLRGSSELGLADLGREVLDRGDDLLDLAMRMTERVEDLDHAGFDVGELVEGSPPVPDGVTGPFDRGGPFPLHAARFDRRFS